MNTKRLSFHFCHLLLNANILSQHRSPCITSEGFVDQGSSLTGSTDLVKDCASQVGMRCQGHVES